MRAHLRQAALRVWTSWRLRTSALAVVLIGHAALFYAIWNSHTARSASGPIPENFTGPTLLHPAIATGEGPTVKRPILSRPWPATTTESAADWPFPPRRWKFPAIDLWPSPAGWCPLVTDADIQARLDAPVAPVTPVTPVASGASFASARAVTSAASAASPAPSLAHHAPPARGPRPSLPGLRLIRWVRPVYPIESALTNMEGSALLDLRIDPEGRPIQISIARSSGAPALDAAALEAVQRWRFAPPRWKGRPLEVQARVELKFHLFSFELSRLAEDSTKSLSRGQPRGKPRERIGDHAPAVRRLIEQLQAGTRESEAELAPGSPSAAAQQALSGAVQWWGPVTRVAYAGFDGNPEWRTYAVKKAYSQGRPATSVAVRWELYQVSHETHTSLWKGAFDRAGRLWAIKADLVPQPVNERSAAACKDAAAAR